MKLDWKTGAVVAAVVLLVVLIVRPSSSGHHFKVTATEYDCNVNITDDPRPLNKEVLAVVSIKCATPPKQTNLVLQLQYRKDANAQWTNSGDARAFTGMPTPDYQDINITQACAAGSWRVEYVLGGVASVLGTSFQELPQYGSSKDISQSQCDNS